MNTEHKGKERAVKILNLGGPKTKKRIDAQEQLICWACSQAIVEASSGNPVAATMILESLVDTLRGVGCEFTEEAAKKSPRWRELFAEDYKEAKGVISSNMERTFYGAGGTSCSLQELMRLD